MVSEVWGWVRSSRRSDKKDRQRIRIKKISSISFLIASSSRFLFSLTSRFTPLRYSTQSFVVLHTQPHSHFPEVVPFSSKTIP